jgi:uncharacterized damage-inducible protein DinB
MPLMPEGARLLARDDDRQNPGLLVCHMFNRQTRHRGQIRAMLTDLGPPDADLFRISPS